MDSKTTPLTEPPAAPPVSLVSEEGEQVSLARLYQAQPLVVQFTRHLGCVFCVDHAKQLLRHYQTLQNHGLEVALVIMGDAEDAKRFRESLGLSYAVFADPRQEAYRAFDVPHGNLWQVAGPHLWWEGLKALVRSGIGRPRGDLMQLGGTYLIDTQGRIVWSHRPASSAEFPQIDDILFAADTLSPTPEE